MEMDKPTQDRLDALLEEELRRGYRIKAVPQHLRALMQGDGVPDMAFVRFSRLNPRRRSKIAEAVQKKYHTDLKNPDILSNDQIAKFVAERGEWTEVQSERLFVLIEEVKKLQGDLYVEGLGEQNWQADMQTAVKVIRTAVTVADYVDEAEREQVVVTLGRWAEYTPMLNGVYTTLYAAEQGTDKYSPDKDLAWLLERMPSEEALAAVELLNDLRDKVLRYIELQKKRVELNVLQEKHARIFADSVESRRDQAEEMARIYFCSERCTEEGVPTGPLAPAFDGVWDFPERLVEWLIIEYHFFVNGLHDSARDYLETFGFLQAEREPNEASPTAAGVSDPSDASPAPQSSKAGTPAPEATAAKSST